MDALVNELKRWRQELHKIPEVGFKEFKTSSYLYHELEKMGYHPIKVAGTGILVYLDNHQDKTIAFRSDIDALKITEETNCDFISEHNGYMHACGHDGHMAALLGLAYRLKENNNYTYNILLIFQPGEEVSGGAQSIIDAGVFDDYHVSAIFGMHLSPDHPEGMVCCKSGPLMAESGELDVTVNGKSAHAGKYHEGIDSVVIAAQLINEYQSIVTRMVSPLQPVVINIGLITGGTVRNIVAKSTSFHGTVRTYSEEVFSKIIQAMEGFNRGKELAYGCKIDFSLHPFNPPVLNDKKLYQQFIKCVDDHYIEIEEPVMLAEDYSHYQKVVPGIFFFLGTKCDRYNSGLHTNTFNFHEDILVNAVNTYYQIATTLDLGE